MSLHSPSLIHFVRQLTQSSPLPHFDGHLLFRILQAVCVYVLWPHGSGSPTPGNTEKFEKARQDIVSGSAKLALAIGEGKEFSSPFRLQTTIRDNCVFGRKKFVTGALNANYMVVLAKNEDFTSSISPSSQQRVFMDAAVVCCEGNKFHIEKDEHKEVAGLPGILHGPVTFSGCEVLGYLGVRGEGWLLCTQKVRKTEDLILGSFFAQHYSHVNQVKASVLLQKCMSALQHFDENRLWVEAMDGVEEAMKEMEGKENIEGMNVLMRVGKPQREKARSKVKMEANL
jgi:hypothetical protein